jgi:hypothetical protein
MLASKSDIKRGTSNDYDVEQVSKAINYVQNNPGSTWFSTIDEEFHIFHPCRTTVQNEAGQKWLQWYYHYRYSGRQGQENLMEEPMKEADVSFIAGFAKIYEWFLLLDSVGQPLCHFS